MTNQVFAALADPHRREILLRLATQGQLTTGELTADLNMSRQGATRHLLILQEAGLVHSHREGRTIYRKLNAEPLRGTTEWIQSLEIKWDAALDRLSSTYSDPTM
ncbi:hypothetical protein CCB80_07190 [Armatimonadetes bacterium Uphvl-Ar1]|jgi:DNA-binding transcriptional ArsR family regulator|nr:hypothetical protein CCB80_07190 [Armatimonadetes bacterium Uphvl-Ar1]